MLSTILIMGATGILAVLAGIKVVARRGRRRRGSSFRPVSRQGNPLYSPGHFLGHDLEPADYVPRERLDDDEDFE